MPTTARSQATALVAAVVVAVLCELVASATHHKHGVAAVVDWVAYIGFWVALAAVAVLLVAVVVTLARGRSART